LLWIKLNALIQLGVSLPSFDISSWNVKAINLWRKLAWPRFEPQGGNF
jgi:hypothetical protein